MHRKSFVQKVHEILPRHNVFVPTLLEYRFSTFMPHPRARATPTTSHWPPVSLQGRRHIHPYTTSTRTCHINWDPLATGCFHSFAQNLPVEASCAPILCRHRPRELGLDALKHARTHAKTCRDNTHVPFEHSRFTTHMPEPHTHATPTGIHWPPGVLQGRRHIHPYAASTRTCHTNNYPLATGFFTGAPAYTTICHINAHVPHQHINNRADDLCTSPPPTLLLPSLRPPPSPSLPLPSALLPPPPSLPLPSLYCLPQGPPPSTPSLRLQTPAADSFRVTTKNNTTTLTSSVPSFRTLRLSPSAPSDSLLPHPPTHSFRNVQHAAQLAADAVQAQGTGTSGSSGSRGSSGCGERRPRPALWQLGRHPIHCSAVTAPP